MGLAILIVSGLVVALIIVVSLPKGEHIPFNDRFPPISDEEFLSRCRPGTDPVIALKVRRIVADTSGVEYERIYPSSRFIEDLD